MKLRILTDNQLAGIVLVGLAIIVLILVLRERLSLSGEKKEPGCSWKLSNYVNILKEGWRVAWKNIWVFWILWAFSLLASIQQKALVHLYRKDIPFVPFAHFPAISLFRFKSFIDKFLLAPVHIPFSFSMEPGIVLLFAVILLINPFKRILSQRKQDIRLNSSAVFLEKNIPFFLIASVIA
ncbi:MAG: hypothetical protein JW957_08230, partial [Candidatus Omnitrophica bacterium]|nr:hypothetical protein [Candidatus Omnitrophota bacterium]